MAENNNWLAQKGHDINDNDFKALGISDDLIVNGNLNREILDKVHQQNMAGYISKGMSEKDARIKADKQRQNAIRMAKESGLKM